MAVGLLTDVYELYKKEWGEAWSIAVTAFRALGRQVVRAQADGYTLLLVPDTAAVNVSTATIW